MIFRNRAISRAGAAALLALGGLAAAGAPAHAAGTQTDLELSVVGTKLAANAEGKVGWAKIANKGSNTPGELTVTVDLSKLDTTKVVALPAGDGECTTTDGPAIAITCPVPADQIPGPGESLDFPVVVFKTEPSTGSYSAPVTFTINSPDDTTPDNNSKTVDVVLSDQSGVDLGVWVPDVKDKRSKPADAPGTPLRAGDTTVVYGEVFNWGDMVANGVKVTVKLPQHVTFAEVEEGCEYSADNRTATCTYGEVVLTPTTEDSNEDFVAGFWWPITVDADVTEPVTLSAGSWTVDALAQAPATSPAAKTATKTLPKNVRMLSAADADVSEVDASDNVDGFAVVVAGETGGNGGGAGGSLPVTGAQVSLLGGIGAGVIVAGGVLFMLARRRRVVLVTPDDEKPTD